MYIARRLLYACMALLLLCQFSALGFFFVSEASHSIWPNVCFLLASIFALVIAGLTVWFHHSNYVTPADAVIHWIDRIDVSADRLSNTDVPNTSKAPVLSQSVVGLVGRLHDYREKLLIRHQRVQRLLRNVSDVLYHADQDGRLTWVTDSVIDMLGYTPDELRGYPLANLLTDPDSDLPILAYSANTVRYPTRVYRRDGTIAWLLISSRRIDDADGYRTGTEGICRDGTRLIETQRELNHEKERAQVTLAAIGDGVITTNAEGAIDYVNPRGEHMLARPLKQLQGHAFESACRLYDIERGEYLSGLVAECLKTGDSREWANALSLVGDEADPDDQTDGRSVTLTVSAIRDEEARIIGVVVVLHDVTRLERISRELTYQANHDSLTGLPNRRAFERELRSLFESARHGGQHHTLCYLDLDQFKLINDSCGHHAGDAMLRQLSSQMATQMREGDILARLGGDEFGIIFEKTEVETAQVLAEQLRHWLENFRFRWEDRVFRLGASLGLSLLDDTSMSATELLRRADTACYLAKEQGRNQVRIYDLDSDDARTRDVEIERMQVINESLDNEGFVLHAQTIQPIHDDSAQSPIGVELLLRMKNEANPISPQSILLIAERYSMASRIDRWVIENALRMIGRHQGDNSSIAYYSVNISGQSITDEQFVGFVRECIDHSGVNPRQLVFEITETAAVTNLQRAADLMRSLRQLGCRFALDDFGSGVSSFSYIKHLPSDFVKIDGKLIRHIAEDPVERSIVEALSNVSQAVGLKTVAEHVETREQFDALKHIGIDYVQGYYIARPIPFEQFIEQLKT